MQRSRFILPHFYIISQVFIILLSSQKVANIKDQVLATLPQYLTGNKIKTFKQSINFALFSIYAIFFYSVD